MSDFWASLPHHLTPKLRSWGCDGDHFLFDVSTPATPGHHETAARSGLAATLPHSRKPNVEEAANWSRISARRAWQVTTAQFMGWHFDFETRNLSHFSPYGRSRTSPNVSPCPDSHELVIPLDALVPKWYASEGGYANAVLDPVYSMTRPTPWWRKQIPLEPYEVEAAFLNLCNALYGDLSTLEIYAWPTDCSSFFDAGREWWGSFFWTIYAPSKTG